MKTCTIFVNIKHNSYEQNQGNERESTSAL